MSKKTATPARGLKGPMAGGKPDNFKESIGKLANYCKTYMWYIIIAFIFAIIGLHILKSKVSLENYCSNFRGQWL